MVKQLKERAWWDPRVYQWPVPLLSFATSVWSSIHCAKAAFGVDPRTKIIHTVVAACGCAGLTAAFYKIKFLRDREKEWGTWRSCVGCEVAHAGGAGVVLGGFIPGLLGGLAVSKAPQSRLWGKRAIGRRHNRVGKVLDAFAMGNRGCIMMTAGGVLAFFLLSNKLAYDEKMWKRRKLLAKKAKEEAESVSRS